MDVAGADTDGDVRESTAYGETSPPAMARAVAEGPGCPGSQATVQSPTALSYTTPLLRPAPESAVDALSPRGYPARRATAEGATLYQAARHSPLLELAGSWNRSLSSSSTSKDHRINKIFLILYIPGLESEDGCKIVYRLTFLIFRVSGKSGDESLASQVRESGPVGRSRIRSRFDNRFTSWVGSSLLVVSSAAYSWSLGALRFS
jgi:hypothetical protein